jgi:hypothetical protein
MHRMGYLPLLPLEGGIQHRILEIFPLEGMTGQLWRLSRARIQWQMVFQPTRVSIEGRGELELLYTYL